jgi:hypothetical protein
VIDPVRALCSDDEVISTPELLVQLEKGSGVICKIVARKL